MSVVAPTVDELAEIAVEATRWLGFRDARADGTGADVREIVASGARGRVASRPLTMLDLHSLCEAVAPASAVLLCFSLRPHPPAIEEYATRSGIALFAFSERAGQIEPVNVLGLALFHQALGITRAGQPDEAAAPDAGRDVGTGQRRADSKLRIWIPVVISALVAGVLFASALTGQPALWGRPGDPMVGPIRSTMVACRYQPTLDRVHIAGRVGNGRGEAARFRVTAIATSRYHGSTAASDGTATLVVASRAVGRWHADVYTPPQWHEPHTERKCVAQVILLGTR